MPKQVEPHARHEPALGMPDGHGAPLPHAWVAGDDEVGRPMGFRRALHGRSRRYLPGVPANTRGHDLDAPPPDCSGHGRHSKSPSVRLDRWCAAPPEEAWTTIEVRDGEKGPLVVEAVERRVAARTPTGGTGPEQSLLLRRERRADGTHKHETPCRMEALPRRRRTGRGWPRRHIGSRDASSAPRGDGPGRLFR